MKRIAILMHERDSARVLSRYIITLMADCWREAGHHVTFLFGISRFVPADVVVVHVDLSVVPDDYLEFAARYPVAVNGRVRDIRKSTFSGELLLREGDSWPGAVLVKSDLNYGGLPERRRLDQPGDGPLVRLLKPCLSRWGITLPSRQHRGQKAYRHYASLAEVPRELFGRRDLVVQRFVPERDGDLWCVRHYSFLGDRETFARLRARAPIVNGLNSLPAERIDGDEAIVEMRRRLGVDYGKFDYVLHEGRAILLDVNKTIGCNANVRHDPELTALRRYRAEGIEAFFR
jgi:hypothetical protein